MTPEQYLDKVRTTGKHYSQSISFQRRRLYEDLREARAAGLTLRQLAEASGLSPEGVRGIINRETKEEGR